jgi:hypothetical protein
MNHLEHDFTVGLHAARGEERRECDRRRVERRRPGALTREDSSTASTRLPEALYRQTVKLAAQDGLTLSELLRALLQREIRQRLKILM